MKQMAKRMLAFLLVLGLVVTGPMAPLQLDAYAAPEEEIDSLSETATASLSGAETKIYVDGSMTDYTGHDGSTAALALQDLKAAVAALGTDGGTVVISGETGFGSATRADGELSAYTGTVTFTSVDGDTDYRTETNGAAVLTLNNDIIMGGPTVLKDINIYGQGDYSGGSGGLLFVSANGNKLVVDTGVETDNNGSLLSITGVARDKDWTGNTNLTIKSGYWCNAYGAGYTGTLVGNTELIITGGGFGSVSGGSFSGTVNGDVSLELNAAKAADISIVGTSTKQGVFAGTVKGTTAGDVYLTIKGETTVGSRVCGGGRDSAGQTNGTTYISIGENAVLGGIVYGGGYSGKVNNIEIELSGNARFNDRLYGGGYAGGAGDILLIAKDNVVLANNTYVGPEKASAGNVEARFSGNARVSGQFLLGVRTGSSFTIDSIRFIMEDNAAVNGNLHVGGNQGTIKGTTYVELNDKASVTGNFNAAGQQTTSTGKITVVLNGGTIKGVFSGGSTAGYTGSAKEVEFILKNGTVESEIDSTGVAEGGHTVTVDMSAGGTLQLLGGANTDHVKAIGGSGTLVLGSGTTLAVTEEPSGSINLSVDGIPANGTYVTAPAGVGADFVNYTPSKYGEELVYEGTSDTSAWKITESLNQPIKVFFDAPEGVEVKVYDKIYGQTDADNGAGFHVEEEDRLTPNADGSYTLSDVGAYLTIAYGEGYYRVIKPFWLSDEKKVEAHKNNGGVLHVDTDPGKQTVDEDGSVHNQPNYEMDGGTTGASPLQYTRDASVVMLNDELREAGFSIDGLKSFPEGGYKTPAFTKAAEKGKHEYSSPEDMAEFIEALDAADAKDIMRHYIVGYSDQYKFPIHFVTFSETVEIPENATLEETAELFKADVEANGKPIVMLSGQLHGNEVSGGEGTMAYMTQLFTDYGDEVLDHVNIIVFPRLNPDGAYMVHRRSTLYNVDMARENIFMQTGENALTAKVYQMFGAHLTIDLHENQANYLSATGMNGTDIWTGGTAPTVTDSITDWVRAFDMKNIAEIEEEGLGSRLYSPQILHPLVRMNYYSLTGSVPVLFEVRGNGIGKDYYDRRVHAHVTGVKAAVPNTAAEAAELLALVTEWREERVEQGGIYDDADPIILEMTQSGTDTETFIVPKYTYGGEESSSSKTYSFYDTVSRSRVRPTAYLIEASVAEADGPSTTAHTSILEMLERNGIEYFEIPAGTTVEGLKQAYAKTVSGKKITEAGLRDAEDVTFNTGAYFIPMDQVSHPIVAYLMEQDMTHTIGATSNGSLYQRGYLTLDSNNNLPIYHYTQNDPRELLKQLEQNEGPAVAECNGVGYGTLTAALNSTKTLGGTVKLLADVTESPVRVWSGITLDLAGHKLTSTAFVGANGSHVVDSSEGDLGRLVCATPMLSSGNSDFPILTDSGYLFTTVTKLNQTGSGDGSKYTYIYLPKFAAGADALSTLGWDADVHFKLVLSWDGGEKVLDYTSDLIKDVYANNKAFYAWITNYANYVEKNLTITVTVASDLGPTVTGTPWTIA